MIVQVKIKSELIEWVANQTGMDQDEAHEFTKEFAGMLYFTGAFEGIGPIEPVVAPMSTVSAVSSGLAARALEEAIGQGKVIDIPSLGIKIQGRSEGPGEG